MRVARENPTWGYTRLRGALKNLGHELGRNTIKRILAEHGIAPAPERGRSMLDLTRFHGVFAPNCKHRESVVPKRKPRHEKPDKPLAPMTWMRRLKRVFAIDIETCPKCGGKLRVIARIENPDVIAAILEHVRAREAATTIHARAPPHNTELPAARYQDRLP